jgi:hypothetical protein
LTCMRLPTSANTPCILIMWAVLTVCMLWRPVLTPAGLCQARCSCMWQGCL